MTLGMWYVLVAVYCMCIAAFADWWNRKTSLFPSDLTLQDVIIWGAVSWIPIVNVLTAVALTVYTIAEITPKIVLVKGRQSRE